MTTPAFHEFLYRSTLAADQSPTVISKILLRARAHNAAHGITGLLVFDGMHFLQHFEGPPDAVRPLMARIAADPRHTGVQVLYEGLLAQRRYHRFDMGFAEAEEEDDTSGMQQLTGDAALAHFLALRPSFDVQA